MKYNKSILLVLFTFSNLITLSQNDLIKKSIIAEGLISTTLNERDFTISLDGKEVYLPGKPEAASFSGKFNDLEPFFSPDGKRIFFNRNAAQTKEKKDFDIWYVEKLTNGKWITAIRLDETINSDKDEWKSQFNALPTRQIIPNKF